MAKQKSKFYVVWSGRRTGIFDNWEECRQQVEGQDQAKYKSFESLEAAQKAYAEGAAMHIKRKTASSQPSAAVGNFIRNSVVVDGACNGRTGDSEYQGVYLQTGERIFHQGVFKGGTNNVMEFLALVHALAFLKKQNSNVPIYSDSMNAISWVKQKQCKTKLEPTKENTVLFELIDRAEKWLSENSYPNPVLKWETKQWGENPADFGRK